MQGFSACENRAMPTYEITAEAKGDAVVSVHAANENEAEALAYREHLHGMTIDGGSMEWDIIFVTEVAE